MDTAAYAAAYEALENLTPMRFDCGSLCGAACCEGEGEELSGMYLYPGERDYLQRRMAAQGDDGGWMRILSVPAPRAAASCAGEGAKAELLLCAGLCPRSLRPLACRIFPLVPYLTPQGGLKIQVDPRARGLCPIRRRAQMDPAFVDAVARLWPPLLEHPEIRSFVAAQSRLLDELRALRTAFGQKA